MHGCLLQTVSFDFVEIFKVGSTLRAGASMLPVGVQPTADPIKVSPVQPSVALENSVLAVRPLPGTPPLCLRWLAFGAA